MRQPILTLSSLALATLLSGCGGGSPVNSTPTPTPTPSPVNYDTAEYQRSNAAGSANAIRAYDNGGTGAGIKIAVIDSGLTDALGEFTGRIDSASRDMAANPGFGDEDGHGTSVAAVAAAARNNNQIMGVAFESTLLALRTDDPGSCASSEGCFHYDNILANAVDYARLHEARIVNISLGGSGMDADLEAAIGRATAAGMLIVIAAGNESGLNPSGFAQQAATTGNGLVIVAGSHDAGGIISDFSNQAGSSAQYYLTALGESVRAFDNHGDAYLFSGTSYAAPLIAGAAAVLADAFPNLTSAQIVSLLYGTADDAGAAGVDSVYGHGNINLTRAFLPAGATTLAGSAIPISTTLNGVLSSAMGDAAPAGSQVVFLDSYGRAYRLDLGKTLTARAPRQALGSRIAFATGETTLTAGPLNARLSFTQPREPEAQRHVLGGQMRLTLGRRTTTTLAVSQSLDETSGGVDWLTDGPSRQMQSLGGNADFALGVSHLLGGADVEIAMTLGHFPTTVTGQQAPRFDLTSASVHRLFGPLDISLALSLMREQHSLLGATFSSAMGGNGARTHLIDLDATLHLGADWSVRGRVQQGVTSTHHGTLDSDSFAIEFTRQRKSYRASMRFSQPLRVSASNYVLNLPTGYDYAKQTASFQLAEIALAPRGRERDFEFSFGRPLGSGWIGANLFLRHDPGNRADIGEDTGAAIRASFAF